MKLPSILGRYRSEVDAELKALVNNHSLPLYDMMRYHLGWIDKQGNPVQAASGKALRPALCLFSCEAVGGDYRRALPAAAALELVHNFSLIHDDIQDDDIERHHRPTVWAIWGRPQAINAGNAMRMLADLALTRYQPDTVSLPKQLQLHRRLDEITLSLVEGQFLDIDFEKRFDILTGDYLTMIKKKTGALLAGSMEIGAFLGTDDENAIQSFHDIGLNIGLAFQIRDDLLGIWGDQQQTGKSIGNDIRRRKKSFPMVFTLENTRNDLKNELIQLYRKEDPDDNVVNRVLEIFTMAGAQDATQKMVETYCEKSRQIYHHLKLSPQVRQDLEEIVQFLTGRNF